MLVQDPTAPEQCAAVRRLVADATAAGESLLATLCALLETEWVLRSRYGVSRKAMSSAFTSLLESPGIEFEHDATVEEALYLVDQSRTRTLQTAFLLRERRISAVPAS
jgi:predicted nucleic-acid-binding protein